MSHGKPMLTPRQEEAYLLQHKGLTTSEIAAHMGIRPRNARRYLRQIRYMIEVHGSGILPDPDNPPNRAAKGGNARRRLERDPEKGFAGLDAITDPSIERIRKAMVDEGIPEGAAAQFIERMEHEANRTKLIAKDRRTQDLKTLLSDRAFRVLESIDFEDIETATLRDKAMAASLMLEKRQLLMGEPTQILSVTERKQLDVLVGIVMQEAQRRGLEVDASGDHTQVIPSETDEFDRMHNLHWKAKKKIEAKQDGAPE